MKTKCLLRDGPADGVVMEVEDGCKQVVIPGTVDGCSLVRHEYTREGAGLFEFVKSVKIPDSAPRSNLDYVIGLRDQITALEAENAAVREVAIEECAALLRARSEQCIRNAIYCCDKESEGYDPDSAGSYSMEANAMDAMALKLRALTPDSGKVLVDLDGIQKIHYWISCAHWAGPPNLERDSLIKAVGGMLLKAPS